MISLRPALMLGPLAALGTGACATYPQQRSPQVFYEAPCDMPGAFRADIRPVGSAAAYAPGAVPVPAPPGNPPTAGSANTQPLCLARAENVPQRYNSRAYRYYNDSWRPYRNSSYFGLGIGFGHFGGGYYGGSRHGRGHYSSGHHGGGHHARGHR